MKEEEMFYSAVAKTIIDYPRYMITPSGDVTSSWRNKKLKHHNNGGYMMVFLKKDQDDKGRWEYIHRLLALHFIPLPKELRTYQGEIWVNHKDGNKQNNSLNNLEWSTISENIQHSYTVLKRERISGNKHWNYGKHLSEETIKKLSEIKLGEKHPKFSGYYIIPDGRKFASAYEAERETGIYAKKIWRYCKYNKNGYSFQEVDSIP